MIRIIGLAIILLLAVIAGGVLIVSAWDPSPPTARIERVVPDDHFPR
ncbi:hypothetical protein [Magnetospirillum fulvum]|jgi:hypothetical protein|uniref:Uncharacterized protein n=1 Tax=Magnetospirillum fulvum MGU-K5 TaxID=1316936 RepID=S9SFF6_MAGFU|nr:hypothetical protein [Magnetospirillum fulvum]EPY02803.1 hypothetical protein K678_03589 [Magnetospirillum fulvum MGU-K5]